MARQENLFNLSGSVGDLVHFRKGKVYYTKRKPETVKQTEATKKSAKDFGTASHWAALFRKALRAELKSLCDKGIVNRCNQDFLKVIHGIDGISGQKEIADGRLTMLQSLELNVHKPLIDWLPGPPQLTVDQNGSASLSLAKLAFHACPKADHAKLYLNVLNFDLENESHDEIVPPPIIIPISQTAFSQKLHFKLELQGKRLVLLVAGISFAQGQTPFRAVKAYAGKIVQVFHLVNGIPVEYQEKKPSPKATDVATYYNVEWETS